MIEFDIQGCQIFLADLTRILEILQDNAESTPIQFLNLSYINI
jgi:hypothetical protein